MLLPTSLLEGTRVRSCLQECKCQMLQVPSLLHHQGYASTYEAARRQLPPPPQQPEQHQQPGPEQEVNQPQPRSPSARPDL